MLIAKTMDGKLIKPQKDIIAFCPACKSKVLAKCGSINIWHWSHANTLNCDSWSEPETEWHYNWKTLFPIENVEVKKGNHIADAFWMGKVIEFQHSTISVEDIKEREQHYGFMIWVLDGSQFSDRLTFSGDFSTKHLHCRWKWKRKSWFYSTKPVFIHLGDSVYQVTTWTHKGFYYKKHSIVDFKKQYLNLIVKYNEEGNYVPEK